MKQDCETSCDSYVLRYLDANGNVSYGNTIIKILFQKINPTNNTITISKEDAKNINLDCIGVRAKGNIKLELN